MFAELIDTQQLEHDGNPVQTWCVGNVVIDRDPNGNIKPNKAKSSEKIDGVAAVIDALAGHQMQTARKIITDCPIRFI